MDRREFLTDADLVVAGVPLATCTAGSTIAPRSSAGWTRAGAWGAASDPGCADDARSMRSGWLI
jgi:hypothetical protein